MHHIKMALMRFKAASKETREGGERREVMSVEKNPGREKASLYSAHFLTPYQPWLRSWGSRATD